jgi:hypothetical protein
MEVSSWLQVPMPEFPSSYWIPEPVRILWLREKLFPLTNFQLRSLTRCDQTVTKEFNCRLHKWKMRQSFIFYFQVHFSRSRNEKLIFLDPGVLEKSQGYLFSNTVYAKCWLLIQFTLKILKLFMQIPWILIRYLLLWEKSVGYEWLHPTSWT